MYKMTKSGLLFKYDNKFSYVPLKSVEVKCSINNTLVNVTSHLTYFNNLEDPIEASFVFPLDEQSAVYHFEAVIDSRCIVAECQEKSEAQETYDRAVDEGYMAFLLEEDSRSGDTFRCSLGNLPAKKEAMITLKFITQLSFLHETGENTLSFVLPSVLNPRYDPQGDNSRNTLQNDLSYSFSSQVYTFRFEACVTGSRVIKSVSSPSSDKFSLEYKNEGKSKAKVTLKSEFKRDHDLSLYLNYEEDHKPYVWYERGDPNCDNPLFQVDVLMVNFLPRLEKESCSNVKNEYVFVVDRSGSMSGSRIEQAKESLLLLLKSLPMGSRFEIIGFGSNYSSLFGQVMDYNEENLARALEHQKSMQANMGGTEILTPLTFIYSRKPSHGFIRNILLLTDGDVSNASEVTALVSKHSDTTRMFAIGIGEGVSTALINGVTRAGKGRAEFVRKSSQLRSSVMSLLHSAMQDRFSESSLQCNIPDGVQVSIVPKCLPPVFGNNYCTAFVCLSGDVEKLSSFNNSVILSGKLNEKDLSFEIPFCVGKNEMDRDFSVRRLAAKYELVEMCEKEEREIDKEAVIFLSTKCNIMSRYTAMVGVDQETKTATPSITSTMKLQILEANISAITSRACSLATIEDKCDLLYSDSSRFKTKSRSKSLFSSFPNPFKGLFSRTEKSQTIQSDMIEESNNQPVSNDPIMQLAGLQAFDGCWKMERKIFDVIKISENTARDKKPDGIDEDFWVTILVIVFFEKSCKKDQLQWNFMVEKAHAWLKARIPDEDLIEGFFQSAKKLI